jgi:hypothetical protein
MVFEPVCCWSCVWRDASADGARRSCMQIVRADGAFGGLSEPGFVQQQRIDIGR